VYETARVDAARSQRMADRDDQQQRKWLNDADLHPARDRVRMRACCPSSRVRFRLCDSAVRTLTPNVHPRLSDRAEHRQRATDAMEGRVWKRV
jgi:hypothetical protein